MVEVSPVGSSGSNGVVERAVQGIEGQLRAALLELESRLAVQVAAEKPIITFLPEYVAYLINRLEVGKYGKTGYERVKGKGAVIGLEFGETVLWKKRKASKEAKLRSRWAHWILV